MPHHVGLRCDGGASIGVGHVIRCLAIADELLGRGAAVSLIGDLGGVAWLENHVRARGVSVVPAPDEPDLLARLALRLELDAIVLDGYHLDTRTGDSLRSCGVTVLAISDGPFGAGQGADIVLDQNLDAVADASRGGTVLTGIRYVLLRDQVLEHRRSPGDAAPPTARSRPRALAVFGGTDAHAAALVVVPLLLATGAPVEVVAVAARPEITDQLLCLTAGADQRVQVVPPVDDLAGLAVTCDLVVTASGSSVWEFLYVGVPAALVCVTANQTAGYDAVAAAGAAIPIGSLSALRDDPVQRCSGVASLTALLTTAALRRSLAVRGQELVDGRGRRRVVDAIESHQSRHEWNRR